MKSSQPINTIFLAIILLLSFLTAMSAVSSAQTENYFFTIYIRVGAEQTEDVATAEILKEEYAKIGINLQIETVEWAVIQGGSDSETRTYEEGGWDTMIYGFEMDDAPDLSSYFHTKNIPPPPGENIMSFSNGLSDRLLDEARTEADPAKQLEMYREWEKLYLEELPALGLANYRRTYIFNERISSEIVEFFPRERVALSDPTWCAQFLDDSGSDTVRFGAPFPGVYYLIPILGWSLNAGTHMTLFRYDADPDNWLETIPNVPTESYEWSTDRLTLTIHLREDLKWSDGVAFTSEDVKFTYEAILDEDTGAVYHTFLEDTVESIETPNNSTVEIHMKQVNPNFEAKLARYAGMEIVPAHALKDIPVAQWLESDYNTGAEILPALGPWVYVETAEGQYSKWRRNPYYYEIFGRPTAEFLLMELITSRDVILANVESTKHTFGSWSWFWADIMDELEANPKTQFTSGPSNDLNALYFNFRHPILTNKYVRQAMAYATPREQIKETIYSGLAEMTDIPWAPGLWSRDPDLEPGYYPYDLDKAKESMVKAGYNYDWLTASQITTVDILYYAVPSFAIGAIVAAAIVYFVTKGRKQT